MILLLLRGLVPALALAALPILISQVRKPLPGIGRPFLWMMNRSHGALTDWGLRHVRIDAGATILDVGCGGGRTLQKLSDAAPRTRVSGIDYSSESVAASRAANASGIAAGRVEVQRASVSQLPFPTARFDLVTAFETHYYWPDLAGDLREIARVLAPGGTLLVVAELYAGGHEDPVERIVMKALRARVMTAAQHREWLTAGGFVNVRVDEERGRGWIAVTGVKPPAPPLEETRG